MVEDRPHYALRWLSSRGPLMKVSYDHIRLKTKKQLSNNIADRSLEDKQYLIKFNPVEEGCRRDLSSAERDFKSGIFGADLDSSEEEFLPSG